MSTALLQQLVADVGSPALSNDEASARHHEFIHALASEAADAAISAHNSAMLAGPESVEQWELDHAASTTEAQRRMREGGTSEQSIAEWTKARDAIVDGYVRRLAGSAVIERAIAGLTHDWRRKQ